MQVALIVNSLAGRGVAGRSCELVEKAFREGGANVETYVTASRGDGEHLAAAAAETNELVVAVGGDGTVNEVARGLIGASSAAHLAVVPLGSGNDFAKVLGMPRGPRAAVRSILESNPYRVDLGRVVAERDNDRHEAFFINAVGVGFDALVASKAQSSTKARGVSGYLYLALRTLLQWRYPDIEVDCEGTRFRAGPTLLATAANGTCSGGGFYLTPDASPTDGQLDVCVVGRPSPVGLLTLVPALLRGKHLEHSAVFARQASVVSIRSDFGLFVHVDGEVVTNNAHRVGIEAIPSALSVRAPGVR
ncbi:MAG: diacylglycerol kinase family lipid kinase [Rhodothermales bacterium]|nr:diacylglycerol kinase family lipid kinase [Rhodothermales bacterium]